MQVSPYFTVSYHDKQKQPSKSRVKCYKTKQTKVTVLVQIWIYHSRHFEPAAN